MRFSLKDKPHHRELLNLAFGKLKVDPVRDNQKLVIKMVDARSLNLMTRLVKLEFHTSLQKQLNCKTNKDGGIPDPHPWDVYSIKPTNRNGKIGMAVSVPYRKNVLKWYDKNGNLWHIKDLKAIQKLSSLSGTVRVLENLGTCPPDLMKHAMQRTNLFNVHTLGPCTNSIETLNQSQNAAVSAVMSKDFKNGFLVIQGPPGTGKSTTTVRMICASDEKAIVSAPSNSAVASLALKLFQTETFEHSQLCVYGMNCDENVQFLNPTIRCKNYNRLLRDLDRESDEKKKKLMIGEFSMWLKIDHESSIKDIALVCCQDDETAFKEAKVICCTLNSSGSIWLRANADERGTFFLDEAGQCNEAEFYLATTFPGVRRVVVVGDPKQLPPTIIDVKCKQEGLGKSWMEKVHQLYPEKVHLLDTQYRMDPLILQFPNQQFYANRIKCGETVCCRTPAIYPVSFIDTSGRSVEECNNFSIRNVKEVNMIRGLIREDDDIQGLLKKQQNATIAVITPYRAQAELLEKELEKVKDMKNWSVSTVDSFQGQEADIVIISTVRTKAIGFIDDRQRLNVALTRAKQVLRIVGCRNLFNGLGKKSTLKKLAADLDQRQQTTTINVGNSALSVHEVKSKWNTKLTQRFNDSLYPFSEKENTFLTTLQAVAKPNVKCLQSGPKNKVWNISSLQGKEECSIVWVAKQDMTIEAHYCGTREACLKFVKKMKSSTPKGSCKVTSDLQGIQVKAAVRGRSIEV